MLSLNWTVSVVIKSFGPADTTPATGVHHRSKTRPNLTSIYSLTEKSGPTRTENCPTEREQRKYEAPQDLQQDSKTSTFEHNCSRNVHKTWRRILFIHCGFCLVSCLSRFSLHTHFSWPATSGKCFWTAQRLSIRKKNPYRGGKHSYWRSCRRLSVCLPVMFYGCRWID